MLRGSGSSMWGDCIMPGPNGKGSWRRRRRLVGLVAGLTAIPAMLVGQAGTASAAVRVPGPGTAHADVRSDSPNVADTKGPRSTAGQILAHRSTTPDRAARPVAPPASGNRPAASRTVGRAHLAASAKAAVARADLPAACSGTLTPDTVQPCTSDTSGWDGYTLTVPDTTDVVIVQAVSTTGDRLQITLADPAGDAVDCRQAYWFTPDACVTAATGSYDLQVQNAGSDYTVSYTALLSDASCTALDTSFAAAASQVSVTAGSVGQCFTLDEPAGTVVRTAFPGGNGSVTTYDATGAQVCFGHADCTLGGTGPYRVIAGDWYAAADAFPLFVNSLSRPQGCLAAAQSTYGTVPDTSSADRCRTLAVSAPGRYRIYAVNAAGDDISGTLYDQDGARACTNSGTLCDLTAGVHSFVADQDPPLDDTFGVVFLDAAETQGCTTTGDTDFADGPATGTFSGPGEQICLTLPTASGATDYILDQPVADGTSAGAEVLDATGIQQCADADFDYATCALTGTAPFHLVLSGQASGGYQLLVQRTDATAGCTAWPQSGFGGSYGAEVTLPADNRARCLTIPAAQHSTGEMIDYENTTNQADAAIYVNDPTGKQICVGASSAVCSYTDGVPYTALLLGVGGANTYKVVRRDVSGTATCTTPASTTVGGASTQLNLTSALYAACIRITGETTDKWWTGTRSTAPSPAGAVMQVTDPTGRIVCWQTGLSCRLSGSASYQLIVVAAGYAGVTVPAHVDTWRVATASGWAPECRAHALTADGFGPLDGSLTESAVGYCAVVAVKPSQEFDVYGTSTASYPATPWAQVYGTDDWSGLGDCDGVNYGSFAYRCHPPAGQDLFVLVPHQAALPLDYTMQGVCRSGCTTPPATTTLTSVSPPSGASGGTVQAVLKGTGLNLGDTADLTADGSTAAYGRVVSVDSGGTELTVMFNLSSVAVGTYDVTVRTPSFNNATLPGAYTVKAGSPAPAASGFTPVTATRILDTRSGLGVHRAAVKAGGVVALQVGGHGGVPAGGVTAVALNVTALGGTRSGAVTAYRHGAPAPAVSSVSYAAHTTVAGLVVVPVSSGKVDLRNTSSGTVQLTADVTGYWTAAKGSRFTTRTPATVLDTRSGVGAPKAPVAAGGTVKLTVAGRGGVPAKGATAVVLDVRALGGTRSGAITVHRDGTPPPKVSTLYYAAHRTVSGTVIAAVSNGKVDLRNVSAGTVQLTAVVTGYYGSHGARFHPAGPIAVMDTRTGLGGAGGTLISRAGAPLGVMDIPAVPLPGTVTAVVVQVTVTAPTAAGSLVAYPDGGPPPTVSGVDFAAHRTITTLVTVPVVNGVIDFYNRSAGTTEVVVGLAGYYAT